MDRQICPEGDSLASRGSPSDGKLTRGTELSIHNSPALRILFLARLNVAKLNFHTIFT